MKKITVLALTSIMLFNIVFSSVVFAEAKEDRHIKIQKLIDEKIVEGDEKSDLKLDGSIKRSELVKIVVYALGYKDKAEELKNIKSDFSDLDVNHWANGVIQVASTVKMPTGNYLVNGYPDGSFKPDEEISNVEVLKILVVISKEDLTRGQIENAQWPNDYIKWAEELGIIGKDKVLNNLDSNKEMVRRDAFICLYNALEKFKGIAKRIQEAKLEKARYELRKGRRPNEADY